jgi:hypothetical protein
MTRDELLALAERRSALIVERMEQRLEAIHIAVPPLQPGPSYWLDSDGGPSYCRACVIKARGKEFELGAPLEDSNWSDRDELEDAFHAGIDGGFDTTSDSTEACETCRKTLSYILTDYGVEEEIGYYREAPLIEVRDEDSYALDRLALNIYPGSPRQMILGVCIAVNQAFRLTSALRAQAAMMEETQHG